jgi:hypothetical protein
MNADFKTFVDGLTSIKRYKFFRFELYLAESPNDKKYVAIGYDTKRRCIYALIKAGEKQRIKFYDNNGTNRKNAFDFISDSNIEFYVDEFKYLGEKLEKLYETTVIK